MPSTERTLEIAAQLDQLHNSLKGAVRSRSDMRSGRVAETPGAIASLTARIRNDEQSMSTLAQELAPGLSGFKLAYSNVTDDGDPALPYRGIVRVVVRKFHYDEAKRLEILEELWQNRLAGGA